MGLRSWFFRWRQRRDHEARITRLEKLWTTVVEQIQTVVSQVIKQQRRRDD